MDKGNDIDIMYINKKHIFVALIFSLVSFPIIVTIEKLLQNYISNLFSVLYMIIAMCIIVTLKNTIRIYKSKYLIMIIYLYSLIFIQSLCTYLTLSDKNILYTVKNSVWISGIIYTSLYSIINNSYIREVNKKKDSIYVYIVIIVIMYLFEKHLYTSDKMVSLMVFSTIMTIGINLYNYKLLMNFPLYKNKEINYMKIGVWYLVVMLLINILLTDYIKTSIIAQQISRLTLYIFYIQNCVFIISRMMNSPYEVILNKYYIENNEMNRLNKEIIHQNRELDFSQKYLKSRDLTMKSFLNNMPIPLIIVDDYNQRIKYGNYSFLELISADSYKAFVNRKLTNFFKIDESEFNNITNKMIRREVKVNNSPKYVNIEILESLNSDEESLVLFTDITKQVNKYKMQELLDNKVFEEKLKRDFLSNISHDLKTPINVIYSAAQLSEIYIKDNNYEDLSKYNKISLNNCKGLIKFTNKIIDESKINSDFLSANMYKENISQVVEEIIFGLVDYADTRNINLTFNSESNELYAEIDVDFIQRIIINLVSNSLKFTKNGGNIHVDIKTKDDEIILSVEDNGIGMDEENLYNAFNRYSMGDNNELINEKGSGIGLFIVNRLVEKQKAKMKIKSKVNEGTKTEIFFRKVI